LPGTTFRNCVRTPRSKALDLGAPIGHPAGGPGFSGFDRHPTSGGCFQGLGFLHHLSVGYRRNKKATPRSFSLVEVSTF
jgi:hypothetical protein